VCDRSFDTPRQLERHQLRKRHWGCSECDTLFNSLMDLEHHKEALGHWSDDDDDDEEEEEEEDDNSETDYDYYYDGVSGVYDDGEYVECNCGCGDDPDDAVDTEVEETEFGAEKDEMEMLL